MELGLRTQRNSHNYHAYKGTGFGGSGYVKLPSEQLPQGRVEDEELRPDLDYGSRQGDHSGILTGGSGCNEFGNSYRGNQISTVYMDERKNALRYNVEGQSHIRGYEGDKDFMRSIAGLDSQASEIAISRYLAQKTIVPQIDPIQKGYPGPSSGPFDGDLECISEQYPRIPSVHPGITSCTISWGALDKDQQIEQSLHRKVTTIRPLGSCANSPTNLQRVSFACHD